MLPNRVIIIVIAFIHGIVLLEEVEEFILDPGHAAPEDQEKILVELDLESHIPRQNVLAVDLHEVEPREGQAAGGVGIEAADIVFVYERNVAPEDAPIAFLKIIGDVVRLLCHDEGAGEAQEHGKPPVEGYVSLHLDRVFEKVLVGRGMLYHAQVIAEIFHLAVELVAGRGIEGLIKGVDHQVGVKVQALDVLLARIAGRHLGRDVGEILLNANADGDILEYDRLNHDIRTVVVVLIAGLDVATLIGVHGILVIMEFHAEADPGFPQSRVNKIGKHRAGVLAQARVYGYFRSFARQVPEGHVQQYRGVHVRIVAQAHLEKYARQLDDPDDEGHAVPSGRFNLVGDPLEETARVDPVYGLDQAVAGDDGGRREIQFSQHQVARYVVEPPDIYIGDLQLLGHLDVGQVKLSQYRDGKSRRPQVFRVPVLLLHQRLQLRDHEAAGILADGDQLPALVEIARAEALDIGHDEDVGEVPFFLGRSIAEKAYGLVHDLDDRVYFIFLVQRGSDIDGDDDIGAHGEGVRYRKVPDDAAVDQEVAVDFDGSEYRRYSHAGAHRFRQRALLEHIGLAGHDIGADAAKGYGELVEIADILDVLGQLGHHGGEPLSPLEPRGEHDALFRYLEGGDVPVMVPLFLDGGAPAGYLVGEHRVPVHVQDQLLQHVRGVARRVEPAHDAPHARAGDVVDLETGLFDDLQDAHMGDALGAAPGEDQGYLRALGVMAEKLVLVDLGRC